MGQISEVSHIFLKIFLVLFYVFWVVESKSVIRTWGLGDAISFWVIASYS